MKALAARRRHPAAIVVLLILGLFATGALYTVFTPTKADAGAVKLNAEDVDQGKRLFLANCSTCHGSNGQGTPTGPALAGVGAAAVDFQVGTGRMPLAAPSVQAKRTAPIKFNQTQIDQLAAYVATLGPGPGVPDAKYASGQGGDIAKGGEIFRVNCAMCHNYAGSGGALTRGKYAPPLKDIEGKHIYEAMLSGPQSMPVFNDTNLDPAGKRDVISYLHYLDENNNMGGHSLGSFGPVGDGFFLFGIGIPIMIGAAVWLGRKAA